MVPGWAESPSRKCQGVELDVAGPRLVREGTVKSGEEERPAGLPGVRTSGGLDTFQVLVICPYQNTGDAGLSSRASVATPPRLA